MKRSETAVDSAAAQRARARLRRKYRPAQVCLLFIGEAPPASGRFFYRGDSGLYRAIRDAFLQVNPEIGAADFLRAFQARGCYLIDVCPDPVDHLDLQSRRATCLAREPILRRAIKSLNPQLIISMVRSIRGNVERAASCGRWQGRILDLPYPGRWISHRQIFQAALLPELTALRDLD